MAATVKYTEREEYLLFQVEGDDSLQASLDYWREIGEKCHQSGHKKALVIENMSGQLSTHELYLACEKLPSLVHGTKVAFVDLVSNHMEGNNFGELVAQNRGCWIMVFQDEDVAIKWLLEK